MVAMFELITINADVFRVRPKVAFFASTAATPGCADSPSQGSMDDGGLDCDDMLASNEADVPQWTQGVWPGMETRSVS